MLRALLFLFGLVAVPAAAQVASPAPEKVAVTIYHDPDRNGTSELNRAWLRGYALITEQRTVAIPAGQTTIRFEGVAAGILPESAIVTGLPQGVREKNLDADLLSPATLYAHGFGRPAILRREVAKKIVEEQAIIRSGPDGAAIVQTREGFTAVDCNAGQGALVYPSVPPGLSAKPTLSVAIDSPSAIKATVTLSYLAWGFDWQADYVATMRPDGASADLMAWITLASSDTTSFPAAETMVVAGKPKREDQAPWGPGRAGGELVLHCLSRPLAESVPPPPPPAPMMAYAPSAAMDIVVTAQRRAETIATVEDLGDLKLYRVPFRTTVAAMSQKQVAFLDTTGVPMEVFHTSALNGGDAGDVRIVLRTANTKANKLGVPLPLGKAAVFQPRGSTPVLIGEGAMPGEAIGEDVEIEVATATQVTVESEGTKSGTDWKGYQLVVRNANPRPVRFEAILGDEPGRVNNASGKLYRKDGHWRWPVTVPANGSATLDYRLIDEN
ncbi:DUF4139 domain-containing protein [Sphingomonas immobilis]|uniref:DUF4139 domain-containing protein n=1 Tax=Sphingomonas immobilis TaxID=3063997 RepID=A0ABT9A267_9SPHN|nr:hypothetical protein [Sphingomonas sp. CA1-15]MDO7843929.1 hypothetical protein [Sphingomonas sp. CA1-15]